MGNNIFLQHLVRKRLNDYIKNKGVKASYICRKCDIDASLMSRFRSGQKVLWKETLDKIICFLSENE